MSVNTASSTCFLHPQRSFELDCSECVLLAFGFWVLAHSLLIPLFPYTTCLLRLDTQSYKRASFFVNVVRNCAFPATSHLLVYICDIHTRAPDGPGRTQILEISQSVASAIVKAVVTTSPAATRRTQCGSTPSPLFCSPRWLPVDHMRNPSSSKNLRQP